LRAVIQRVNNASVTVDHKVLGTIGAGLLVLIGIEEADQREDIVWMVRKLAHLRIFNDDNGVMNLSLLQVNGEALVISQFTLHASTKKGNRPSYIRAAKPEKAIPMYEEFVSQLISETGNKVATGIFGADMKVQLLNDGPVTIIIDSRNRE
jgi:D-tyrosyl-tRNA(Tyr) deacylase